MQVYYSIGRKTKENCILGYLNENLVNSYIYETMNEHQSSD